MIDRIGDIIKHDINPKLPTMAKSLLEKLDKKELTMGEFEKECCYWALDYLDEYRFRAFPTRPQILETYLERKGQDPKYEVTASFWRQPAVESYMYQWHRIDALNAGNKYWLNEMQRHIPKEDTVNQTRVKMMLDKHLTTGGLT